MGKLLLRLRKLAFCAVCVAFVIAFACLYNKNDRVNATNEVASLSIWQIDSFEGGKGSRSEFLQKIGDEFKKQENCYVNVVSISADAARLNLSKGNVPDLISYGAGMYGIETFVNQYSTWCRGSYCLLTLNMNCDFSDVAAENTIINKGKDNFAGIAALFCNVQESVFENATSAYVKLINGEYEYLLGTQRDIFRLKTRNVSFSVKAVSEFNDLYQNISITTNCNNSTLAQKYIDYLLLKKSEVNSIGMFNDGIKLYDDELGECEKVAYDYKITYPIGAEMKENIEKAISLGDINMIKNLLK